MKKSIILLVGLACIADSLFAQSKSIDFLFRKNDGQWNDKVQFKAITRSKGVRVLNDELSFVFTRSLDNKNFYEEDVVEALVWNLEFINANPESSFEGETEQVSSSNYFIGDNPNRWVVNAKDYQSLIYPNLYPNIDLKYYRYGEDFKYDYIVHPKGKASDIKMNAKGVKGLQINRMGQLEITTEWGVLIEERPYSYQLINGIKKEVDVRFELLGSETFGFTIHGKYDKSSSLVIDPVTLKWASYVGGTTSKSDGYVVTNKIDNDGNVYITGYYVDGIPVTPGLYGNVVTNSMKNAYIIKMAPDGTAPIWSTFIGGSSHDVAQDMEINNAGDIYICGNAKSSNFPRKNGTPSSYVAAGDAFILKLSNDGQNLAYSTLLGGTGYDIAYDIAIDDQGNAAIMGLTESNDLVGTSGSFQSTNPGGTKDYFFAKYNANGVRQFASYLGGSGLEGLYYSRGNGQGAIAFDSNGQIVVAGNTTSTDFPVTTGAYKTSPTETGKNLFVAKFSADGKQQLFGTYIGLAQEGELVLNDKDEIFIVGTTESDKYPVTPGVYDGVYSGDRNASPYGPPLDAFVTKLKPDGSGLVWSTILGDDGWELGTGIAIDSKDQPYISMAAYSKNMETDNCSYQKNTNSELTDAYVIKLSSDGKRRLYSTMIGGSNADYFVPDVSLLEKDGCVCQMAISSTTHSMDYPVSANAYQKEKFNGGEDQPAITVLKHEVDVDFQNTAALCNTPVQFSDISSNPCSWEDGVWQPMFWKWDFGDGATGTGKNISHTFNGSGTFDVKLKVTPCDSIIKKITISSPFTSFDLGPDVTICGQTVNHTIDAGSYPGATYTWQDGSTGQTFTATSTGTYWVKIGNGSCTAIDSIVIKTGEISGTVDVQHVKCAGGSDGSITALPSDGTAPYTYSWGTGQTTQSITGVKAGTYPVTATDANGCSISATIKVNEPDPIVPTVTKTDGNCSGLGGSVAVSSAGGTGSHNYRWSNGSTASTMTNVPAGTYTVTITDQNGCSVNESITVNSSGNMTANATITYDDDCDRFGGSLGQATAIPQGGTGPYTYQWDDPLNQTGATATGLSTGTYNVVVTDAQGCSASGTAEIKRKIQITINKDIEPCAGCSNGQLTGQISGFGTPPFTYRWNDTNEQTSLTATGLTPGKYVLLVTDANGCYNSDTVSIGTVGIASISSTMDIKIYPNPTTGVFQIDADKTEIYELSGKHVLSTGKKLIDLTNYPKGMYLIRATFRKKVYYAKLVLN